MNRVSPYISSLFLYPGFQNPEFPSILSDNPRLRVGIITEYPDIGINEEVGDPSPPSPPLVFCHYCDPVEFAAVIPNEFYILPCNVDGVTQHVPPVKQDVHLVAGTVFMKYVLFELLIIGQGKFPEDGDTNEIIGFLNGNHGLISIN